MHEYYFNTEGSESDLAAIRWYIEEFCEKNGIEIAYYRKIKSGHIPTIRECKLKATKRQWRAFRDEAQDLHIPIFNYWQQEHNEHSS